MLSLFMNVGVSMLLKDLIPLTERFFLNTYSKYILIFIICITTTRDTLVSIVITLLVYILLNFFLDETSDHYIFKNGKQENYYTIKDGFRPTSMVF